MQRKPNDNSRQFAADTAALLCIIAAAASLLQAPLPHAIGTTDTPGPRPPTNPYVSNGLRIRGNVFINEAVDDGLGLSACIDANIACNAAQVR
jgi:hypothetical protein